MGRGRWSDHCRQFGLIVFRDALLRIDANSTESAYRTGFNVNAHEIAHQWFGDLVTVPWWNDIWLNEAFATWAQGKATVDLKPDFHGDLSRLVSRLEGTLGAMRSYSLLSARKIRQPILSNDDIQTAFDGITYQKGAAVLRMFEEWLGETNYRQAMRAPGGRHRPLQQAAIRRTTDLVCSAQPDAHRRTAGRSAIARDDRSVLRVARACRRQCARGVGPVSSMSGRYPRAAGTWAYCILGPPWQNACSGPKGPEHLTAIA
jgi:hypothetical protein